MKECPCKKTMRILLKLGAKHAAAMHRNPVAEWSNEDWLAHFLEEEEILIPLLVQAYAFAEAARILEEHRIFRLQLAIYGRMHAAALRRHGLYEDRVVIENFSHLDDGPSAEDLAFELEEASAAAE